MTRRELWIRRRVYGASVDGAPRPTQEERARRRRKFRTVTDAIREQERGSGAPGRDRLPLQPREYGEGWDRPGFLPFPFRRRRGQR